MTVGMEMVCSRIFLFGELDGDGLASAFLLLIEIDIYFTSQGNNGGQRSLGYITGILMHNNKETTWYNLVLLDGFLTLLNNLQ